MYEDGRKPRLMRRNLTLAEARKHCQDPETSSISAKKPRGCGHDERMVERWHDLQKHWFDGYERE
jgi:hypothetical protein